MTTHYIVEVNAGSMHRRDGWVVESGWLLIRCTSSIRTEGSNPSLSEKGNCSLCIAVKKKPLHCFFKFKNCRGSTSPPGQSPPWRRVKSSKGIDEWRMEQSCFFTLLKSDLHSWNIPERRKYKEMLSSAPPQRGGAGGFLLQKERGKKKNNNEKQKFSNFSLLLKKKLNNFYFCTNFF